MDYQRGPRECGEENRHEVTGQEESQRERETAGGNIWNWSQIKDLRRKETRKSSQEPNGMKRKKLNSSYHSATKMKVLERSKATWRWASHHSSQGQCWIHGEVIFIKCRWPITFHRGLSRISLLFKCESGIKTLSETPDFRVFRMFATVTPTLAMTFSNNKIHKFQKLLQGAWKWEKPRICSPCL